MKTRLMLMCWAALGAAAVASPADRPGDAIAFDDRFDLHSIGGKDAAKRCKVIDGRLHIRMPGNDPRPITIPFPKAADLSAFRFLLTKVTNTGSETFVLRVHARDATAKDFGTWGHYTHGVVVVRPGETRPLAACLDGPRSNYAYLQKHLPGMHRYPGMFEFNFWRTLDASQVAAVRLTVIGTSAHPVSFTLGTIGGAAPMSAPSEKDLVSGNFFPFVDRYGQYNKVDWQDKIHRDSDLVAMRKKEEGRVKSMPALPSGWNAYGGWADGPKLKATGHFRVEKHAGKWWLVDPEGCLFWSKGSTGMDSGGLTRTPLVPESRRRFFEVTVGAAKNAKGVLELPLGASIESIKYGDQSGEGWKDLFCIRRAHSFGINTAGAWSTTRGSGNVRIPYTEILHPWSTPFSEKLPDPFDPSFREGVRKAIATVRGRSADDPWCIGYFINNEMGWEPALVLGKRALEHRADRAAKQALIAQLESSYGSIEKLNQAWASDYDSWADLAKPSPSGVPNEAMKTDLARFGEAFCDTFFRTINELMDEYAPNKLYLGDRFNRHAAEPIRACARHADVVSFNRYELGVEDLRLPQGCEDRPIIVGEFSFVRDGRSLDSADLGAVFDPDYRGRAYSQYIVGALQNPAIVGCHWFQWMNPPVSGRGDGENYEQGFVDTSDTPYWRLADYSRDLAASMYDIRLNGRSAFDYNPPVAWPVGDVPRKSR